MTLRRRSTALLLLFLLLALTAPARAIIILGDVTDPNSSPRNVGPAPASQPGGFSLSNYEGQFGAFLGTPIAPDYFLAAAHIGDAGGGTFVFNNGTATATTYHVTRAAVDGDLAIWKVTDGQKFSLFAPLNTTADEVGRPLVTIGTGGPRGAPVEVNGVLHGWKEGPSDGQVSWGTNTVSAIAVNGVDFVAPPAFSGDYLQFDFLKNGNPNEAIFSGGDSSGGTFVQGADGVYRLAGINSLVTSVYSAPGADGNNLVAAFDIGGLYDPDGNLYPETNPPTPASSYATRISSRLAFIESVTGVPEPSSLALLAVGFVGLGLAGARRRAGATAP